MTVITPFRGLRYDPTAVSGSDVIAGGDWNSFTAGLCRQAKSSVNRGKSLIGPRA